VRKDISSVLSQMRENITSVQGGPGNINILDAPNCPHCADAGYVRFDVPIGHEKFGKLESCICRAKDVALNVRNRFSALSSLERLGNLGFENFNTSGNERAKFMTPQERKTLFQTFEACKEFAHVPDGWLLLEGGHGCGKTHLAAAIANNTGGKGIPTLFITVSDLLDSLRFAYGNSGTTFEKYFDEIRTAGLLILDDFGAQNATTWAQEKIFQIINYRYINKLPTVVTTNVMLDDIEGRVRSRLQDDQLVKHLKLSAPDYRNPEQTSNPGISMLSLPEMKAMTFQNFQMRKDEAGRDALETTITEKQDKFGGTYKDKALVRVKITMVDIQSLHEAFSAAVRFSKEQKGLLLFLGGSFCGKTHLAAAIGNYRIALGGQATLVEVSSLLNYLRQNFRSKSGVSFDRRFEEICETPLLILDNMKESDVNSAWAEDKLYRLLNYRYNAQMPTVLNSALSPDSFALSYPNLWSNLSNSFKSQIHSIHIPPYHRMSKDGAQATRL